MISLVLILPVLLGLLSYILKNRAVNRIALLGVSLVNILVATAYWFNFQWDWMPGWLLEYFKVDSIGLYFFSIMTIVFSSVAVYSLSYFKQNNLSLKQESTYILEILLFVMAMTGVILATHLALLWVFVEATTLTSAMLIYFSKKKSSLEATWKYVYICSIGITLAFVGIILLSIGSRSIDSLFFSDLYKHASEINPFWLKLSFAFIFVGLGTKVGITPFHAWLPDAHSEAPSPVSALLSGTLLNTAFLGIYRVQEIFVYAKMESFSNFLFLVTGFLSLMVCSVFILRLKNYKRMLAYSSIENMGLLFIALSLGKVGIFIVMLQVLAHSLSKTSLFLTSGNILYIYKSKKIDDVKCLLKNDPKTGWLWIISIFAIIGLPPFPVFMSKFLLVKALWTQGLTWLTIPFFLFLVIITYGMSREVFKMVFGENSSEDLSRTKLTYVAYLPQIVLLIILLIIGINIPQQMMNFINNLVELIN
jgi:hydrogenase-4 component F